MIRPDNSIPGRPPKVTFPITRTIVEHGREFQKTINENTTVRCYNCGDKFLINRDTVFHYHHKYDDMTYVRCPHCGFKAAALYYFDRKVG